MFINAESILARTAEVLPFVSISDGSRGVKIVKAYGNVTMVILWETVKSVLEWTPVKLSRNITMMRWAERQFVEETLTRENKQHLGEWERDRQDVVP